MHDTLNTIHRMTSLTKIGKWKGCYPSERIQAEPYFSEIFCSLITETSSKIIRLGTGTDAEEECRVVGTELLKYAENHEQIENAVVISSINALKTGI